MRQKALALLSGFSYIGRPVKITQRRRGLGNQLGTVRDLFWHKEEPWVVVQFSSGKRAAVPVSWTDVPSAEIPAKKNSPQADPARLLEMAKYCQQLTSAAVSKTRRQRRKRSTNRR
jgi:hypothetical protein